MPASSPVAPSNICFTWGGFGRPGGGLQMKHWKGERPVTITSDNSATFFAESTTLTESGNPWQSSGLISVMAETRKPFRRRLFATAVPTWPIPITERVLIQIKITNYAMHVPTKPTLFSFEGTVERALIEFPVAECLSRSRESIIMGSFTAVYCLRNWNCQFPWPTSVFIFHQRRVHI